MRAHKQRIIHQQHNDFLMLIFNCASDSFAYMDDLCVRRAASLASLVLDDGVHTRYNAMCAIRNEHCK